MKDQITPPALGPMRPLSTQNAVKSQLNDTVAGTGEQFDSMQRQSYPRKIDIPGYCTLVTGKPRDVCQTPRPSASLEVSFASVMSLA